MSRPTPPDKSCWMAERYHEITRGKKDKLPEEGARIEYVVVCVW